MTTITLTVYRRASSRSTSYNWRDVEDVLLRHNLPFTKKGLFATAIKDYPGDKEAIQARRDIEDDLLRVHRNCYYRFEFQTT